MNEPVKDVFGNIIPNYWDNPWICQSCGEPYDYAENHFTWVLKKENRCPAILEW